MRKTHENPRFPRENDQEMVSGFHIEPREVLQRRQVASDLLVPIEVHELQLPQLEIRTFKQSEDRTCSWRYKDI